MTSIKRTSRISIYIRKKVSNELLVWLNTRKEVGPAILDVLEKNVSSEYIHISEIDKYVTASNVLFNKKIDKYEKEITKLENDNDKNKVLLKENIVTNEIVETGTLDKKEDAEEIQEVKNNVLSQEIKNETPHVEIAEDNSDLSFEEQLLLEQRNAETVESKSVENDTDTPPRKKFNVPIRGVTDQTN